MKYEVTASSLNVRTGPGTSYRKTSLLYSGATVYISEVSENNWGYLTDGTEKGWISLEFCKKVED